MVQLVTVGVLKSKSYAVWKNEGEELCSGVVDIVVLVVELLVLFLDLVTNLLSSLVVFSIAILASSEILSSI